METETWLPVVGYEGLYEVSDLGRVRSIGRDVILKPYANNKGYLMVGLWRGGKCRKFLVHVLVLTAFTGPCPEGHESRHGPNGNQDNRLSELRWGTKAENMADKLRDGTDSRGDHSPRAKLTAAQVATIQADYAAGAKQDELAARYGVCQPTISHVVRGKAYGSIDTETGHVSGPFIGEANRTAKLTAETVRECRERQAAGESMSALAREFGVTPATIEHVIHRRTWAHVA